MSARQLLPSLHLPPRLRPRPRAPLLPLRRPVSTNSAINRGLRRSPRTQEPTPTPTGLRITRSIPHPRLDAPPPESGIWTPPGAPPRPKNEFPPPPSRGPGGATSRTWKPLGSRVEEEEEAVVPRSKASDELTRSWSADAPVRPPRTWSGEERPREDRPRPWSSQERPREDRPRPWSSEERPRDDRPHAYTPYPDSYSPSRSFIPGARPSPRLDAPPADREWAPKPRRFIPKADYEAEWIYGTSVVEAALRAGRRNCLRLYIYAGRNRTEEVRERDKEMAALANGAGAEVVWEEDVGVLDSMSDSRPHNGYVLETHPLPKTPILALGPISPTKTSLILTLAQHTSANAPISTSTYPTKLYSRSPKGRYPLILMLDEILDPGNLGAILRSAYFLGVTAVTLSARNCAPLSAVVLKASAGAAEFLPILEHARAEKVVQASIEHGWSFFAAVPPVTKHQGKRDRYFVASEVGKKLEEGPVCLVLGGEGEGLRQLVKRECEFCVGLERAAGTEKIVDSLNVSVASALLCNAFLKG